MPKGEKTLRQILTGDLLTQINEIWRKGESSYHSEQRGDNIQGTPHCKAVETNLGKLIPDFKKENELKPIDLFVLSAAACLHDIGKVVNDDAKGWKSDHGKRSMEIIVEQYDKLGIQKEQAIAVGLVVSAHGDGRLDELPRSPIAIGSEEVNVIELAAIFRLADMLDTNCQRAPEILSKIKFPDGNVPAKWLARQSITGWYLDERNRVILQSHPKQNEIDSSYTLRAMMNEDLSKITPYLKPNGYPSELGELDVGDTFLKPVLTEKAILQRPFPGMAFYTKNDAKIFKGRNAEIENLLSLVTNWPITLLIGESGSGKTSLIHAGLFAKLETMLWKYVWTRPFDNPKENIKKMIWLEFFEGEADPRKNLLDVMKQAAEKCKPHQLLVVMDQFEDMLSCSVQEILDDFSLDLMAVQTCTVIPNLRVLISFREDALVKLNSRFLKKITGSAQQFPSVELERLTRDGAKAALLSGMENSGIGLDPRQEKGQKQLIEIILDDIQKGDDRLYPPYIQMVAETLCKNADPNKPIITREIYFEQLKGADNIIAHYLIERLNEFGVQKDKAEKVLIYLTSSVGRKAQKSLTQLSEETEIEISELQEILNKMIDLRMVRVVSEDEFEIIHDYLGKIVDQELVNEEDRTIKFLEEQLDSYYQNFKVHGTPILSPPFLASLYRNRKRIKMGEEKLPLILCGCVMDDFGLGWYWLKDVSTKKMFEMLEELFHHEFEDISDSAEEIFVKMVRPADRKKIMEMLHDEDEYVRETASEAFLKISEPKDRDKITKMLHDEDKYVRYAAIMAFLKIAELKDKDEIMEMLHDKNGGVREAAIKAFVKIAEPKDQYKIMEMLHDQDARVRWAAKEAFVKIVESKDRDKIMKMLHDQDGEVRWAVNEAFVKIVESKDRDKITKMLRDEDEDVRGAARKAFLKIAEPKDRDKIMEMLHDEDVRETAIEAFEKIAEPKDRDKIMEMLHDEDEYVRGAARKAFLKIAEAKDQDKIMEMLHDEDEYVRGAARKAFLKIAEAKDQDKIMEMLHDQDGEVRWAAKEAFVKIVESKDRDKIIELLQNQDKYVRSSAEKAFVKISESKHRAKIMKMLHSQNPHIWKAAIKAFEKIARPEDREYFLDLIAEHAQGWSENQRGNFEFLAMLDEKFYCKFYSE